VLVDAGAGWLLSQDEFSATALRAILDPLLDDRAALLPRARAAGSVASRDASQRAATLCLEACHG
jgi:UDP-N-acetylglucosamine:LPS N-acetylglucosamine transferase